MNYCKYCGLNEAIENSHIIPSYIYKWIKKTSVTGYLRSSDKPNRRQQDGEKSKLLCIECEEYFSVFENSFKNEVFDKATNFNLENYDNFEISESSIKCIYVMVWRTLANFYYFKESEREHSFTNKEIESVPRILHEIKDFIKEGYCNEIFNINIIPWSEKVLDVVNNEEMYRYFETKLRHKLKVWDSQTIPYSKQILDSVYYEKIRYYSERSVSCDLRVWDNPYALITYIKIPFLMIVFEIGKSDYENNIWIENKIQDTHTCLYRTKPYPFYVESLINFLLKGYFDGLAGISDKQVEKIMESYDKAKK